MKGDSLVLKFPNNINVNLSHWNYDTFQGKFEYKWYGKGLLQFNLNKKGEVRNFNFIGIDYTRVKE